MPQSPYQPSKQQYAQKVTVKIREAFLTADQPNEELGGWLGYFNFQDPTVLKENCLTYPSQNCFIPMKDKISPRLGSVLLGQPFTAGKAWPIIGNKKAFATMSGIEVEVRVTQSNDTDLKDIIEVLYPSPLTQVPTWYQITENVNPLAQAVGKLGMNPRYYFDDWFDTDQDPALSLDLTRLIGTNGTTQILSWSGGIAPINVVTTNTSITTFNGATWASLGFIAPTIGVIGYTVIAGTFSIGETVTGGTSGSTATVTGINVTGGIGVLNLDTISGAFDIAETITGGTSGATGAVTTFNETTGGTGNIIVNGVAYAITGGWSTDTLLLPSTAGIVTEDVALAQLQGNTAPIPFDVCRQNDNYMYYGAWNSRKLYQSNGFSKNPTELITAAQAVQNDIVVGASNYTGTQQADYQITIDSVNPNIDIQTFVSGGNGNLNDGLYDTSSYAGAPGVINTYSVLMLGDLLLLVSGASGSYLGGETVQGSATKAEGTVVYIHISGGTVALGIRMNTVNGFSSSDTIIGLSSGTTGTVSVSGDILAKNFFMLMKNGAVVNVNVGAGSLSVNALTTSVINLTDGLTIQFSNDYGHAVGDSFQLEINEGGADTFTYKINGGTPVATMVPITGALQSLGNGVTISFVNKTGHTLGDTWTITATPGVSQAWVNFYYTLPTRLPGEGYIFQLPSNFWTMAPQESQMYVNTTYGEWQYVTTKLAANLQTEAISLTPLKQASANKVLYPYMINYLDNDLAYITMDRTIDLIGRMELIQLPHITTISQPVSNDFQRLSFEDGSMEYWDKKLWMTSPHDREMMCYDNLPENLYWQPPQAFSENGILSVYDMMLISHSNTRNQTNTLFSGTSGDNGANYTVRARTPYLSKGARWSIKNANMTFIEGHITGAPPMMMDVILGVNGCAGFRPHPVVPVMCVAPDRIPFGQSPNGTHPFASDVTASTSYFNEIYERYMPILQYYFLAFELSCTTTNHSYDWLTVGLNSIIGNIGNNKFKNKAVISRT